MTAGIALKTRHTFDCYQSNYSSRIVFSYSGVFGPTGNSAIRSADPENRT